MNFSELAAKRSARLKQQQQRESAVNVRVESVEDKSDKEDSDGGSLIRELNEDIELRQTRTRGRGVFARRKLSKGSTVLSSTPIAIALEAQYLGQYCSYTAKRGGESSLARCSLCKIVHYASKQAQREDWAVHKHECGSLRRASTSGDDEDKGIPQDAVRVMARLLWQREHKRSIGDLDWEKQIDDMHDTYADLSEEDKISLGSKVMQFMDYFSQGDKTRMIKLKQDSGITIPYVMRLMSKIQTNAFALQGSDFETVGVAICPVVAFINHDQHPNCAAQFAHGDNTLSVTLFRDVEEGEELTTSYVDPTLPWSMQREALKKQYRFDIGDSPEEAVDSEYTQDLLKTVDEAEKMYIEHPLRAFQRLQPHFDKVERTYALHSKIRVRYMRLCFAIMISVSLLDDIPAWAPQLTVQLGKKTLESLKLILPFGHPIRAMTLAELAKQMLANSGEEDRMSEMQVVQKLEQCVYVLEDALREARIGYGSGSTLERYLADEVASIRQEVQMRRLAAMAV